METSILSISKEDGVRDLPFPVRAAFAHAIQEERLGHSDKAEEYLQKAIEAEAKARGA